MPPEINVQVKERFKDTKDSLSTFFYPASGVDFKNHKVIINACMDLKKAGVENYKFVITLNGNENDNIKKLFKIVKENNLPVNFIGSITREEVFDFYNKSVLVFPSYIESSPLPLTEAKLHNTPIIVSDCAFSHEILDGYAKVNYFDPFNSKQLADELLQFIRLTV
ncbi:glycosyltransferase [Bacillus sp. JJ1503]|uniref:glycosyltransferase n=1 Tax=Bacillus sp. JJ1503 TaxID=3122956 RepID=UPI002FFF65AA